MDTFEVVRHDALRPGPPTGGMVRQQAQIGEEMCVLEVHTEPFAVSGWHHHGDHTTYVFVLAGKLHFDFGPGGSQSIDLEGGDFVIVPPHTIHREGNPSPDEQILRGLRIGTGPTAFNVDGPDPAE